MRLLKETLIWLAVILILSAIIILVHAAIFYTGDRENMEKGIYAIKWGVFYIILGFISAGLSFFIDD